MIAAQVHEEKQVLSCGPSQSRSRWDKEAAKAPADSQRDLHRVRARTLMEKHGKKWNISDRRGLQLVEMVDKGMTPGLDLVDLELEYLSWFKS